MEWGTLHVLQTLVCYIPAQVRSWQGVFVLGQTPYKGREEEREGDREKEAAC